MQESQSIGALNAAAGSPFELKPPPGRVGATILSGLPPLKPPPGRLNPLPPEPPSFRPSGDAAPAAVAAVATAPPPAPQQPGLSSTLPPRPPAGARPGPPLPLPPALAGARPGPPPPPDRKSVV